MLPDERGLIRLYPAKERAFVMNEDLESILDLIERHNTWRIKECINLIASENVTSPLANAAYLSDAMHRYAEGLPFKRFYQGTRYIDELEYKVSRLFASLFKSKYADVRAISGTVANATAFTAIEKKGGTAIVLPLSGGAHVSHSKYGVLGRLGFKPVQMPIIQDELIPDVDETVSLIRRSSPKLIVLGASVIIFPHPVKEIVEASEEVGAKVVFDAAHILGLIAGEVYPNPLEEGAHIMTTSTHKTFPGPQGGAILTNSDELYEKISRIVFPVFVSNHHLHRLAPLGVTTLEMMKFGKDYATQIVRNAKRLAESLSEKGFKVLGEEKGFTQTHQVLLDVRSDGGGDKCAKKLEKANIIVNKNILPWDSPSDVHSPSGIRIGVQEVTRLGMREDEMEIIADLIYQAIKLNRDTEELRRKVTEFKKNFVKVHYTFDIPLEKIRELTQLLLS